MTLEKAIKIAIEAHWGHKDRAGEPYILHCFRVMLSGENTNEQIAGVLHDVLEDSSVTVKDLENAGFSKEIIEAVEHLTHLPNESYEDYIKRVSENPIAIRVKLNDLADNMNLKRLKKVGPGDIERQIKYFNAMLLLKYFDKSKQ